MGRARQNKIDTIGNGLLAGVLTPLVILILFYLIRYSQITLTEYLTQLWKLNLMFKILSLCGIANLLFFFWFFRKKMDKAARGVIMGTLFYALLFLVFEIL